MPNLYTELGKQDSGTKVQVRDPLGNPLSVWIRSANGHTEFTVATEKRIDEIEAKRFKDGGIYKMRNQQKALLHRKKLEVNHAERQEIQRELAPEHVFLGFDQQEWEGLENTLENRRKMLEIDWFWAEIRQRTMLSASVVDGEDEDDEAAEAEEKNSASAGDGTSGTDDAEKKSPPAKRKGTRSTKTS